MSEPTKRRRAQGALAALAAGSLLVAGLASAAPATAAPPVKAKVAKGDKTFKHDFRTPLQAKQAEMRKKALEKVLAGKATPTGKNKVVKLAKGQYVELARESTDKIFTVLVEFGDNQYPDPRFQGPPPDGSTTDVTGPLHNQIPAPNRAVDNSTLWQADYNQAHYQDMYFNRMAEYYETQSSGRYSVDGTVTEWVKVPFNEALYGRNYCGDIVCNTSRALIRDALAVWVKGQRDAGKTTEQIAAYLRTFDQQDRYDIDGDSNFNEPDGVIDHFQLVHAGGDEAAGDPHQGTDAIWSHRSAANLQAGGPLGAGIDVGSNGGIVSSPLVPNNPTGVWVYDYTIQPENGGLGVFAHEFGHDLGLPDLYDTSGNTGGAENSTAFWTLMSSGANIGDGSPDGIGDAPTDMGTWEKLQLGWLNYDVARAGEKSEHKLNPSVYNSKAAQALITILPEKAVPQELGAPCSGCGSRYFFSGAGDELDNSMSKTLATAVAAGTPLTAKVKYQIEKDWDYAYLVYSTDGGAHWTSIHTNLSTNTSPNGQNFGEGITGTSGGNWVDLTASLPALPAGALLGFRYWTDVAATEPGFQVDNIALGGTVIGTAENENEGWTFDGFRTTTGSEIQMFPNYYIAENRQYVSYDKSLKTAYNFGFLDSRPDWVENYPYQNGLLINYWDTSQNDNNVGDHPGEGLILPVDAHPTPEHWANGQLMRQRIQSYDSTFGLERTDAITLHLNSAPTTIASKPAVPVFDDTKTWWYAGDGHSAASHGRYQVGWTGVDVPKTGTTIRVKSVSGAGSMQVQVAPK